MGTTGPIATARLSVMMAVVIRCAIRLGRIVVHLQLMAVHRRLVLVVVMVVRLLVLMLLQMMVDAPIVLTTAQLHQRARLARDDG